MECDWLVMLIFFVICTIIFVNTSIILFEMVKFIVFLDQIIPEICPHKLFMSILLLIHICISYSLELKAGRYCPAKELRKQN